MLMLPIVAYLAVKPSTYATTFLMVIYSAVWIDSRSYVKL